MGNIRALLQTDPDFFRKENETLPYWQDVHDNAVIHTRRGLEGDKNKLLDEFRPNEGQLVKDYRTRNERQFTKAGFDMFLSKCMRVIRQCVPNPTTISKPLKVWLEAKPFNYLGEMMDLHSFTLDVILRKSLENPNQLLIAFPYTKSDISLPPNRGNENVEVGIKPLVVSFKDIRYMNDDCFSISGGMVELSNGETTSEEELYFSADSTHWYQHIPKYIKKGKANVLAYDTIVWYKHNTGENLLNFLAGEYTCSRDDEHDYLVSFIESYFNFANAAKEAASDEKIVHLRNSFPIAEIKPTKCHVKDCYDGKIGHAEDKPCRACEGKGWTLYPKGPAAALISEDGPDIMEDGRTSSKPSIQWHMPPLDYSKAALDRVWTFIDKAYQSIGMKMFSNAGASSSGDALREWQVDELDKLARVTSSLYSTVDRFLYQCECLLVRVDGNRIRPRHIVPERMGIVDLEQLKVEAESALPEDKLQSHKLYHSKKYRDDPVMSKGMNALLCYSPVLTASLEEIELMMAKNVCTKDDIIKKQWASIALDDVIENNDISDMSKSDIHKAMDTWFIDKGLIVEKTEIYEEEQDLTPARVGELQALVNLNKAVGAGEISEGAAEMILVKRFNFSSDDARQIVEGGNTEGGENVPQGAAQNNVNVDDILHALIVGRIPQDDAINQLAEYYGKSTEEVESILRNSEIL